MVKFLLKQKVFNYFCVLYYAILFLVFFKVCFDFKYVIKYNISAGNFENFEKNFGQKITKSREKYFEIHCFRTRNFLQTFRTF